MKDITNVLKRLYTYTCDIYEFVCQKDEESKKTYQKKILVYEKIPCRISYYNTSSVNNTKENVFYNEVTQYIKLFLQKDISIKSGSIIKIFKDSQEVAEFKNGSKPYVYSNHQEVAFKLKQNIS